MNRRESYTFIVMGKTGAGKSSILNSLVGFKKFPEGKTLRAETKEVVHYEGNLKHDNSTFTIIDTPGFYDTEGEDQKNVNNIVQFFKNLKESGGLNCVFFVIPLTEQRFDQTLLTSLNLLRTLLGDDLFDMIKIIYTFKNHLNEMAFQKSLERFKDLPEFLISSGFPVKENLETFIFDYDNPDRFCREVIASVKKSRKAYPEVLNNLKEVDFNIKDPIKIYAKLIESSEVIHTLSIKMSQLENIIKTYETQCDKFEKERKQFKEELMAHQEEMQALKKMNSEQNEESKKQMKEIIGAYEARIAELHQNHLNGLETERIKNEEKNRIMNENFLLKMEEQRKYTTEIIAKMTADNQTSLNNMLNVLRSAQQNSQPHIIMHNPNSRSRPSALEYIKPIGESAIGLMGAASKGCSIF